MFFGLPLLVLPPDLLLWTYAYASPPFLRFRRRFSSPPLSSVLVFSVSLSHASPRFLYSPPAPLALFRLSSARSSSLARGCCCGALTSLLRAPAPPTVRAELRACSVFSLFFGPRCRLRSLSFCSASPRVSFLLGLASCVSALAFAPVCAFVAPACICLIHFLPICHYWAHSHLFRLLAVRVSLFPLPVPRLPVSGFSSSHLTLRPPSCFLPIFLLGFPAFTSLLSPAGCFLVSVLFRHPHATLPFALADSS